ncbi:hypothetical protein TNCV_3894601 [Trichonephila clavipes]|nr:hypothetical protein TNCV_3894601 [Trichonephila clavipes]
MSPAGIPPMAPLLLLKVTFNNQRKDRLKNAAFVSKKFCGRGSRVVKVSDRGWPCHEFEPRTTKDPACRAAMHLKSVESSNVAPVGVEW